MTDVASTVALCLADAGLGILEYIHERKTCPLQETAR